MSGSQDIREWARSQGIGVSDKGRLSSYVMERWEEAHPEPNGDGPDEAEAPLLMVADEAPETPERVSPVPGPVEEPRPERPPQQPPGPRTGILGRKPRKPREVAGKGKPRHPRVSLENLISFAYGGAAMVMQRGGERLVPVGRVMQMQAPLVGYIADDRLKGTAVDRMLQPLARMSENGELAVAVAGPPLIVAAITAHPEWYPALAPMLKMALQSWFSIAGPAADKMRRRASQMESESAVSDAELENMIAAIFSDIDVGAVPSSQEEANIRKARGDQPNA